MTITSPVKWHGGKSKLASRIIDLFPEHRIYLEPFGGGASILLNKPPSEVETYNDLDRRISRLFRVLREQGEAFIAQAQLIPYSRIEFERCQEYPNNASDLEMALRDFVRWRQSFGGQGQSWSHTTKRARGGMAGDVNAWWNAIDKLPEVIARLRRVQIDCRPAIEAIRHYDDPNALIYCDPPYVHATRAKGSCHVYNVEMTDGDHHQLADTLNACQAKVVLSGYPSPQYEELYKGWRTVDFDRPNDAAGGKSKRRMTERLWMNY